MGMYHLTRNPGNGNTPDDPGTTGASGTYQETITDWAQPIRLRMCPGTTYGISCPFPLHPLDGGFVPWHNLWHLVPLSPPSSRWGFRLTTPDYRTYVINNYGFTSLLRLLNTHFNPRRWSLQYPAWTHNLFSCTDGPSISELNAIAQGILYPEQLSLGSHQSLSLGPPP
jgi:hypothetical protein